MKHPIAIYFILVTEFCERFSYYGMRTILSLYMVDVLKYSEDGATVLFHSFAFLSYFFPLIGGIIADVCIGKFRTIMILSMVYATGNVIQATSATPPFSLDQKRWLSILSLILIATGTGGIKPCVSAFGGDQYSMPDQAKELAFFYSIFYFSINVGSLTSTFITPILRNDVKCFGENRCFPLAFGLPALLMIIAIIIFVSAKRLYTFVDHQGNAVIQVTKCVFYALSQKLKRNEKEEHWLDHSLDRFGEDLVNDTKAAFHILKMFLLLPIFWALYDQQGSRWTFQATRMDGRVGPYTIKPDQMQLANPLLVLLLIPTFDNGIYPACAKCLLLTRPLQRLPVGGLLAALSFVVSALVEFKLEGTYPVLPKAGSSQVRIFNGLPCEIDISSSSSDINGRVESFDALQLLDIPTTGSTEHSLNLTALDCPQLTKNNFSGSVEITEGKAVSLFAHSSSGSGKISQVPGFDEIDKGVETPAKLRVLYNLKTSETGLKLVHDDFSKTITLEGDNFHSSVTSIPKFGKYELQLGDSKIDSDFKIEPAGIYTLVLGVDKNNDTKTDLVTITPPNSIHILWLLPQYILITAGEIMFSITGLNFSYTQAPESMKSLLSAAWLLTTAFGNLIVVFIAEIKFFQSQAYEFLLFAALMAIDMLVLIFMATLYKYSKPENIPDFEKGSFFDLRSQASILTTPRAENTS